MRHRTPLVATLMVVLGLLASSCSQSVSGNPVQPGQTGNSPQDSASPSASLPYMDPSFVGIFHKLRQIDLCGLHAPAAAQRITGHTPGYLTPGEDDINGELGACSLQMDAGKLSTLDLWFGWRFSIRAGSIAPGAVQAPVDFNGTAATQVQGLGGGCEYFLPTEQKGGLAVIAEAGMDVQPRPDFPTVCQAAGAYFSAILPKLKQPPMIDKPVSGPRMDLAGVDPCVAFIPAVAEKPDSQVSLVNTTHNCRFLNKDGSEILVMLQLEKIRTEGTEKITLGGLTAYRDTSRDRCVVQIPVNDRVFKFGREEGDSKEPGKIEAITFFLNKDCANTALADKMVTALLAQKKPPLPADFTPQLKLGNFPRP